MGWRLEGRSPGHRHSGLPSRRRLRRRREPQRRPLPLPADGRGHGHLPVLRGPPRTAVGGARRPRAHLPQRAGRDQRRELRRLGAQRQSRARHRGLQRLGRDAHRHAHDGVLGHLGDLRPRRPGGPALQVRDPVPRPVLAPEGRPHGPPGRGPPVDGLDRDPVPLHLGGRGVDGRAGGQGPARGPHLRLRDAPGQLAPGAVLPGDRRAAHRPRSCRWPSIPSRRRGATR